MAQFSNVARQALGDDAPDGLRISLESAVDEILRGLRGIEIEAASLRAYLVAASDEEGGDPGEAFFALGMLGHAGASGTIGSKFEKIVAAQSLIQGLARGYKYGKGE